MILGIDPGPEESAYAVLDYPSRKIITHGQVDSRVMGDVLGQWLTEQEQRLSLLSNRPVVAIEGMQSYGIPAGKTIYNTLLWIGRYCQVAIGRATVWPLFRPAIRGHFLGGVKLPGLKTADAKIRATMVQRWLGQTAGFSKDQWSALAIATMAHDLMQAGKRPDPIPRGMVEPFI